MQRKFLRERRKSSEDDVGRSDLPLHCQPRVATGDLCILIYALSVRLRSSSCCSWSREGAAVSRADGRAVLMPATLWREERAGKERLPQQGPLTAKTDSGWQEQKLSSYMSFSTIVMEQKWKNRTRKKLNYIHIHAHKHTCVYIHIYIHTCKSKHANIYCPHSILLMLEKSTVFQQLHFWK